MEPVWGALHLLRPESSESQAFKAGCRAKQALHAACSDGDGADADQAGKAGDSHACVCKGSRGALTAAQGSKAT